MTRLRLYPQSLFIILTAVVFIICADTPVMAGIVTTPELVNSQKVESDRERIKELLSRADIQKALEKEGVDPVAARQRVDSMTDAEIQTMAEKMDQLPAAAAAGSGLSTIEWLLVIIIVLLII